MGEITKATQTYLAPPALAGRAITDIIDRCLSASERSLDGGKLALRNMPTADERVALTERVRAILGSFASHDQKEIAADIMDMLAAYDVAQAKQLTASERKAATVVYVRELHGVPDWAIREACRRIRLGIAPDISKQYKPTPIQVRVLSVSIAQPLKNEVRQIGEVLSAPLYVEGVGPEERKRVGIKMRTLADELKEGKYLDGTGLSGSEKEMVDRLLRQAADNADMHIAAEYARMGVVPIKAGHAMVSPALARQIEAQKKAHADKPHEPLVL